MMGWKVSVGFWVLTIGIALALIWAAWGEE